MSDKDKELESMGEIDCVTTIPLMCRKAWRLNVRERIKVIPHHREGEVFLVLKEIEATDPYDKNPEDPSSSPTETWLDIQMTREEALRLIELLQIAIKNE